MTIAPVANPNCRHRRFSPVWWIRHSDLHSVGLQVTGCWNRKRKRGPIHRWAWEAATRTTAASHVFLCRPTAPVGGSARLLLYLTEGLRLPVQVALHGGGVAWDRQASGDPEADSTQVRALAMSSPVHTCGLSPCGSAAPWRSRAETGRGPWPPLRLARIAEGWPGGAGVVQRNGVCRQGATWSWVWRGWGSARARGRRSKQFGFTASGEGDRKGHSWRLHFCNWR